MDNTELAQKITELEKKIDALLALLDTCYESGDVKGKAIYSLLANHLRVARAAVEKYEALRDKPQNKVTKIQTNLARAAAIWNIEQFEKRVKLFQKSKFVTAVAAEELLADSAALLGRLRSEL